MICGRYYLGLDHIDEITKIRTDVFEKEQGIKPFSEVEEIDETAIHAVVYKDNEWKEPIAVGRLYPTEKSKVFKIGRIAVEQNERGQGYGDFVVRMLLDKGFQMGAEEIIVGAQEKAIAFYEKIGFQKTGESYLDALVLHTVLSIRQSLICRECQKEKK